MVGRRIVLHWSGTAESHSAHVEDQPTFRWTNLPDVDTFEIYLQTGSTVIRQAGLTSPRFTPSSPLAPGSYRWWIRGFAANGKPGKWSAPATTDIGGRPTITVPNATAPASSPSFEWTAVSGASTYSIYIDRVDVPGFVFRDDALRTNSPTNVTGLIAGGTYRVWVRAINATGTLSPWSFPVTFAAT